MNPEKLQLKVEENNVRTSLHPIFTKDPAEWMKLVNCEVQISTEDGEVHTGCVYTVDPVSETIVLIKISDGSDEASSSISLKLLVGSAVNSVNIISDTLTDTLKQSYNGLFRPAMSENINAEELNTRKLRLKSWLEKNRLPVSLTGDSGQCLTVADALTVQPPYTENCCLSTNEIILLRIQTLIKSMPSDVSS